MLAALEIAKAIGDAIKELGSVPAGHLYARLMGKMTLQTFDSCIGLLVRSGVCKRDNPDSENDLIVYCGGK